MVELGYQDTDWVGGQDGDILDVILLQDGFILATLSMVKENMGILGAFLVGLGP